MPVLQQWLCSRYGPLCSQNVSTRAGSAPVQIFGACDSTAPDRATCTIVCKGPKAVGAYKISKVSKIWIRTMATVVLQ